MPSYGYIPLFRQLENWEWYKTDYMVRLWVHLLMKANYKDERWNGMVIKRGQLVTSRARLHEETGISDRTIRTCINRLKSTSEIAIKTTNKFTVITISKYDFYQNLLFQSDQQNDQHFGQQATSNRPEEEKDNNINNISCSESSVRMHERAYQMFFEGQIAAEVFCKNEGIDIETCKLLAKEVLNDWALAGETHHTIQDARNHLLNLLRIKISIYKEKRQKANARRNDSNARRADSPNPLASAKRKTANIGGEHEG